MRNKILDKSVEMFLTLGFKSVTMDDIASEIGISKKTIYQHFKNKSALVEATVFYSFDTICDQINAVCREDQNPIEELFRIKNVVRKYLRDEKSSPYYQLKKYYPRLHAQLVKKQYEVMLESVKENLDRGIRIGLFRDDLDTEFVSRIYFSGMNSIKDDDLFPHDRYSIQDLTEMFLNYHLRAIVTSRGLEELNQILKSETQLS